MLRSSLGFHTITASLMIPEKEALQLAMDFRKYHSTTEPLKMYYTDPKDKQNKIYHPRDNTIFLPGYLKIYYEKYNGIKWTIRYACDFYGFNTYIVDATINPKMMGGMHNYITAATYDDMEAAITNFNLEASKISPLLKDFYYYTLTRIDYCVNFDLDELLGSCNPELIMDLIKRGNIPHSYTEWTDYDNTAHRKKSKPGSFYLINNSVNINCYSKYIQLLELSKINIQKEADSVSQTTLDAARSIIRFEVQYKYHKVYMISKEAEISGNLYRNKYESLLSYEYCIDVVSSYFNKVIRKGDWYTLQNAVSIIKSQHFNSQKEERLIDALQLVNQCRSVAKAKKTLQACDLKVFKKTLKELSALNVNPVTIPKEKGIKHIPNLLYAYYDKVQEERSKKEMEKFHQECLYEYFHRH